MRWEENVTFEKRDIKENFFVPIIGVVVHVRQDVQPVGYDCTLVVERWSRNKGEIEPIAKHQRFGDGGVGPQIQQQESHKEGPRAIGDWLGVIPGVGQGVRDGAWIINYTRKD